MAVNGRRLYRLVIGVALLVLVVPTVADAAGPYEDVDHEGSPHSEAISRLTERGVFEGRDASTFDPAGTVTRAQLASVLARAADLEPSNARPFDDVIDGPHAGNIGAAYEAGLVEGYTDGTFRPSAPIARDQIAALLYRWVSPPAADGARFDDLADTVHAHAINALADIDVARGSVDGTFRPRASLRRDQAASFVWRALQWAERDTPAGWDGRDVVVDEQPEGDVSGVAHHGTIPVEGVSSLNVVSYEQGEVMVAFGTAMGLRTYDLTDPDRPTEIGHLPVSELALEGDDPQATFWSAESVNIDKDRDVLFLSRDPRAMGQEQDTGVAGFYLIDIADPTAPELLGFHEVPAGHTATCVNDCDFLWSGGPAPAADQPDAWVGRPIFVTDVRDLDDITTFEDPVDTGRYRGWTDYAHDVQVDQMGVAWVSGRGGVRGYWTEGVHLDPTTGEQREATANEPIPYKGGEVGEYNDPDPEDPDNDPRMFGAIHNSERPVDGPGGDRKLEDSERPRRPDAGDGGAPAGHDPGDLIYVTDENFSEPCADAGKFYINSLASTDEGQGWYDEGHQPSDGGHALEEVGVWSVADKEGAADADAELTCSAHYFQMREGIVAGAWYTQGHRFLDVTDPSDPIQIAYFRPDEGNAFKPMWHGDIIYAGDSALGIHILSLDDDAEVAAAQRSEVLAPQLTAAQADKARATTASLEPDDVYGWSCALPGLPPEGA